jgi:hypothetical protein
VDASGNAYVSGLTGATDFPTTSAFFGEAYTGSQDAFVSEIAAGGSTLVYSGYLGGGSASAGTGIAVDEEGNAWVTGYTEAADFPITEDAFQDSNAGGQDAFVTEIAAGGATLNYSTYLGGSGTDEGNAIALDPLSGDSYVAGVTDSTDFPTSDAYQADNAGGDDAFLTQLLPAPPPPVLTGISPDTGISADDQDTMSQNIDLLGTAAPDATVSLYEAGLGYIGTTEADASDTSR